MDGACVDVTERREKEEALRAADRQKDEFLGMLAHELRNPLAPIIYSVAALERQMPAPEARRPLEIIARQARRMTRIVDDLLDVSRVTQGKISLQRERLDVVAIVGNAADVSRAAMTARGHQLEVRVPDVPLPVSVTRCAWGRFVNVLNNAAKYTPPNGHISVAVAQEGEEVVLRVSDTGVGIPVNMLSRIFDLFVQGDQSLAHTSGGLGIGLTLVHRLVKLHHGRVEAQSDGPGRGSQFTVALPLSHQASAPAGPTSVLARCPPLPDRRRQCRLGRVAGFAPMRGHGACCPGRLAAGALRVRPGYRTRHRPAGHGRLPGRAPFRARRICDAHDRATTGYGRRTSCGAWRRASISTSPASTWTTSRRWNGGHRRRDGGTGFEQELQRRHEALAQWASSCRPLLP